MSLPSLLWLFPIIFMIHDFEEIIMMRPFFQKNGTWLQRRFPRLYPFMLATTGGLSTSGMALAVACIFVTLAVYTFITVEGQHYSAWAGVVLFYFIHVILHIGQGVALRRYVPVVITSVLTSFYCVYALWTLHSLGLLDWGTVGLWAVMGAVVTGIVLGLGTRLAQRFDRWLESYTQAKGS